MSNAKIERLENGSVAITGLTQLEAEDISYGLFYTHTNMRRSDPDLPRMEALYDVIVTVHDLFEG